MRNPQFIVLTNPDDERYGHVPLVAPHMGKHKLLIIDPVPDIVAGKGVSLSVVKQHSVCSYNGIRLDQVAAVWDRRPTPPSRTLLNHVNDDYYKYSWSAVKELGMQIYCWFPDALWISDYFAIQRAERKSLQLVEATSLGFRVPQTIMTSDPEAARKFVATHPVTIVKGMSVEGPVIDRTLLLFFSTRITPEHKLDYAQLSIGPAIFQQAIEAVADLRITVVGDKIFPAEIHADAEDDLTVGVRDWRIGNHTGNLSITPHKLPADVKQKCFALVKKLGLKFGAIDMILDKQGRYWFLEINPNGQWAFVEMETGQPIGKAMADLLLSGAQR
jgi:hypothetical protein